MKKKYNVNSESKKNTEKYRKQREKNNLAVKKSRQKAQKKIEETKKKIENLKNENKVLKNQIIELKTELNTLNSFKNFFFPHYKCKLDTVERSSELRPSFFNHSDQDSLSETPSSDCTIKEMISKLPLS